MSNEERAEVAGTRGSAGVTGFFARFASAREPLDMELLRPLFAQRFLVLDPGTVMALDRESFLRALPGRERFFASAGAGRSRLTSLCEQILDARHTLVSTEWSVPFSSGPALTLCSSFLLRRSEDDWQIVVYLNHQDLAAALSARIGLQS